jgi:hypothetical protein
MVKLNLVNFSIFILGILFIYFICFVWQRPEIHEDIISDQEGFASRRRRRTRRRRRQTEGYTENFKLSDIGKIFSLLGSFVPKVLSFITKFPINLFKTFVSIFSYIICGFTRILTLPKCFGYYLLEIIGHILYIPFAFGFWLLGLGWLEKQIWDLIDKIDCAFYSATGFHLIHYSDTIIKNCYSCKIIPMPHW